MPVSFTSKKKLRKGFGKIKDIAPIPNLIDVQRDSYYSFLQADIPPEERRSVGLQGVFKSVFPIKDYEEKADLEFLKYELEDPKYNSKESIPKGVSCSSPLRVTLRLIVWDNDEKSSNREIKSIKEQDVYFGEMPLMTERGTFVINGAERVVVSQMHRSPGVFYDHDRGRTHSSGKKLYSARIIPYRGSWLDIEFDHKDVLYCRIDRKRKICITTLLRCLGLDNKEIFDTFYDKVEIKSKAGGKYTAPLDLTRFRNKNLPFDIVNAETKEVLYAKDSKITPRKLKESEKLSGIRYFVEDKYLVGKFIAEDIVDNETGEVVLELGDEITTDSLASIKEMKLKVVNILNIDYFKVGPYIRNTFVLDKNQTIEESLAEVYKVLRPGEPSTPEVAKLLFHSLFFDISRYDLTSIGRMKLNTKHRLNIPEDHTLLTKDDIIAVIRYLLSLKDGMGDADDIDHLGNRRLRCVGEQLENQYRLGLVRMERVIVEKMAAGEIDTLMPHDLINPKVLMTAVKEFFGTSQLSQFMDQTNPLSEITHKRRISALGPGGLTRDRAGFEVRDVHTTHYGRICPIETPEGQNIGLINSLASYSQLNKYGFIESPYRVVKDECVTDEVVYLSAIEEEGNVIASADIPLDENGAINMKYVNARKDGESISVAAEEVKYVDVSPKQLVSVAASLIPFLENDDANRALMGSNMQRQAVPLLTSEAPLIGTGMEAVVAKDSGAVIVAKRSGVVENVDANRIVIRYGESGEEDSPGVDIYTMTKYTKSNQGTCINQKPIAKIGDAVTAGDIIADGPSTDLGELALGKNALVAFMPWNGYNFEDSIIISERLVRDDVYTSVHIKEFEVIARDTRLGPEEITRDIPNCSEESLRFLDEIGIVNVGAKVKTGDIIVGKITPKTESLITPEEKLLRAIFGEKVTDVRDSSLKVPPGVDGVVIGVKLYTRRGVKKDDRAKAIEKQEIDILTKDRADEINIIEQYVFDKIRSIIIGQRSSVEFKGISIGQSLEYDLINNLPKRLLLKVDVEDAEVNHELSRIRKFYDDSITDIEARFKKSVAKVQSGDDLPQGALKVVKVYVATKLKLQPGDKMAGRHGNKGVVSKIVPIEDMPFLEDGTPVDIVLNPIGVPSRMNLGQIFETHFGLASANLGKQIDKVLQDYKRSKSGYEKLKSLIARFYKDAKNNDELKEVESLDKDGILELADNLRLGVPFATPVFDGASENDIDTCLEMAGLDASGQLRLIDGRSGEYFDRKVTVGYKYMLKLDHLVNDKIHARSIGPYSLVTQQPLGGKSHFGGQRFGEMECWALQAYGAAHTLQEMLTVKSDDVNGRVKMYESIIRGDSSFESGLPESFNVMVKEMRSLCLNIELQSADDSESS